MVENSRNGRNMEGHGRRSTYMRRCVVELVIVYTVSHALRSGRTSLDTI